MRQVVTEYMIHLDLHTYVCQNIRLKMPSRKLFASIRKHQRFCLCRYQYTVCQLQISFQDVDHLEKLELMQKKRITKGTNCGDISYVPVSCGLRLFGRVKNNQALNQIWPNVKFTSNYGSVISILYQLTEYKLCLTQHKASKRSKSLLLLPLGCCIGCSKER